MDKFYKYMGQEFNIGEKVLKFCYNCEQEIKAKFNEIDNISEINQCKVLKAMQKNKLSDTHFATVTGYGYNDIGRDVLEDIYKDIFKTENALVRPQIISGTNALTIALFGNLRYGDELYSPVGRPYDTLEGVIGHNRQEKGSLKEHGISYAELDLLPNGQVDFENIASKINSKTKLVTIQRSKGYTYRPSLQIDDIEKIIKIVKNVRKDIICMVDNCYGEFVDVIEPTEVGADLVVGSLIKNPGGGLAPVGGYIVGKKEYVDNAAYRLTAPGQGKEVGPSLGISSTFLQGLFLAPSVVASSLKSGIFISQIFEKLGFDVLPKPFEKRTDIVQAISLKSEKKVIKFCEGIQKGAPVDSFVAPVGIDTPGYDCPVIMAAGTFVQGASIEFSADAPLIPPYNVFMQGGLTWQHAKIGTIIAINEMFKNGEINI